MEVKVALVDCLLSYNQSSDLDKRTIAAGFPEQQLMGQAAVASANVILENSEDLERGDKQNYFFLCGMGNNGGDGFAIAYVLLSHKAADRIRIYSAGPVRSESARFYSTLCDKAGIRTRPLHDFCNGLDNTPANGDVIVEAILGNGQKGDLRPPFDEAAKLLVQLKTRIRARLISIDAPLGLTDEKKANFQEIPVPDEVHCYGSTKLAIALHPDLARVKIKTLPIGFQPDHFESSHNVLRMPHPDLNRFLKDPLGNKYTAGAATIIGGQSGMEGAALLASDSFFASGGGILEVMSPSESARSVLLARNPGIMTGPVRPGTEFKRSVLAIGPGLRIADADSRVLLSIIEETNGSIILDASACNLVNDANYPESAKARTVMTPHAGEWKKIGGPSIDCVDGLLRAIDFMKNRGWAIVKGPVTCLIGDGKAFVRVGPNPNLAVAGSGDCLTGILTAALSRQSMASFESALIFAVASALGLLDMAATSVNPGANDFPGQIRRTLEKLNVA